MKKYKNYWLLFNKKTLLFCKLIEICYSIIYKINIQSNLFFFAVEKFIQISIFPITSKFYYKKKKNVFFVKKIKNLIQ